MELITSADLKNPRHRRRMQELLPEILRRLVQAKTACYLHFPSGDSIVTPGYDGTVEGCEILHGYIPLGNSVWEFGTEGSIYNKAKDDFEKRTKNSLGVDKAETTFVFVTTQSFTKRSDWLEESNDKRIWKKVVALNVDDLIAWINDTPQVEMWLVYELGIASNELISSDQFWSEWNLATDPKIPQIALLLNRKPIQDKIHSWLAGSPDIINVKSDSAEETIAFLVSCLHSFPDDTQSEKWLSNFLIIDDNSDVRRLVGQCSNCIFVLTGEAGTLAPLVKENNNYAYVVASDEYCYGNNDTHKLPMIHPSELEGELINAGNDRDIAIQCSRDCKGNITIFRRLRSLGGVKKPEWAKNPNKALLIAALIGTFDSSNSKDRDFIEKLYGGSYSDFEIELRNFSNDCDAPVSLMGSYWSIRSRRESLFFLHPFIPLDTIKQFRKMLFDEIKSYCLGRVQGFEKQIEQLFNNSQEPVCSKLLIDNSINGMIICSDFKEPFPSEGKKLVEDLLDIRDKSFWNEFSYLVYDVAEISLPTFVEKIDEVIDDMQVQIFQDDKIDVFGSHSIHVGILFGIEKASWNENNTIECLTLLTKLDHLDPGGTLGNRPINSIHNITRLGLHIQSQSWLDFFEDFCNMYPDGAWKLFKLMLDGRAAGSYPNEPIWSPIPGYKHLRLSKEQYKYFLTLGFKLTNLNSDIARWVDVLSLIGMLRKPYFYFLTNALRSFKISSYSDDDVNLYRTEFKDSIIEYDGARRMKRDWALPLSQLRQLKEIYNSIKSEDETDDYLYLFKHNVGAIPSPDGKHMEYASRLRKKAVRRLFKKGGLDLVIRLAERGNAPESVGKNLAFITNTKTQFFSIVGTLLNKKLKTLLWGFVRGSFDNTKIKEDWIITSLKDINEPDKIVEFLLCINYDSKLIRLLFEFPKDIQEKFWEKFKQPLYSNTKTETEFALKQLSKINRHFEFWHDVEVKQLRPLRAIKILEDLPMKLISDYGDPSYTINRYIHLLRKLESRHPLIYNNYENRICDQECQFMEILDFSHKPIIFSKMEHNPKSAIKELKRMIKEMPRQYLAFVDKWKDCGLFCTENNTISQRDLQAWCNALISESDKIIQGLFAELLASIQPENNLWPRKEVANIIEQYGQQSKNKFDVFLQSFCIAERNKRGTWCKGSYEGGDQERDLSKNYQNWAGFHAQLKNRYTKKVLCSISDHYTAFAQNEDNSASVRSY